jgi:hypothetical protein
LTKYISQRQGKRSVIPHPLLLLHPSPSSSILGKMLPISRIVNSFESPQLPTFPCPLIPFSSSGVPCQQCRGSDLGNPAAAAQHSCPWLVSLLSEEIQGLIVKGKRAIFRVVPPSASPSLLAFLFCFRFSSSPLSLPTKPSRLRECLTSVCISSSREYISSVYEIR